MRPPTQNHTTDKKWALRTVLAWHTKDAPQLPVELVNDAPKLSSSNWLIFSPLSSLPRPQPCPGYPGAAIVCDTMGLFLLVLLLPLAHVSALPFYNGFYYSNSPHDQNPGNGYGEGRRHPGSGN